MKVILSMVMSADGKTTKWGGPKTHEWTSKEDHAHFLSLLAKSSAIIMGRKTFDAVKSEIKLSPERLRIVLTNRPNEYESVSVGGQLEFTNDTPQEILKKLKDRGYAQVLLAGGEQINALFFKAKLIDEVWLTIEPFIFGCGHNFVAEAKLNITMQLKSVDKLNEQGTIVLKYQVV